MRAHSQMSPYLESCCLRVSANVSYEDAAADVAYLTGVQVSSSVQQRLVHRQSFELPLEPTVAELSVDGGNIRVRTPVGEPCVWQGYKAVCLHELKTVGASFQDNAVLIDWINAQPVAPTLTCLGDGHDGIWNIVQLLAPDSQRREVLDWFHLVENLSQVGGSLKRLQQTQALLWQGQVDAAIALFTDCIRPHAHNFCQYLEKHRHRIINYQYYQAEQICSIGSGAVESTIKQIDRRTKISGASVETGKYPSSASSTPVLT